MLEIQQRQRINPSRNPKNKPLIAPIHDILCFYSVAFFASILQLDSRDFLRKPKRPKFLPPPKHT